MVGREGGKPALDTFWRRVAGRVLPADDDPQYRTPDNVTTYVLGYLKEGPAVRPWGDEDRIDTLVVCQLRYR